ncbi:MAG: hypothetical protein JXB19_07895 [Bacteroidales bacterium]|nr:hypothetical protein [Bacteroidales bacterium]
MKAFLKHNLVIPVVGCMLTLASACRLSAQDITVRADLDTNRALIGDQLNIQLTVEKPEGVVVSFPEIAGELAEKIEVVRKSGIDTMRMSEGFEKLQQELVIAVFDTGFFEIPPLKFVYQSGHLYDTVRTLPTGFEIIPLPLESEIRDIKANYRAPITIMELLPYIIAALVTIVAIWLVRAYYRKKYTGMSVALAGQMLGPPDAIALIELEKLRAETPWLHNKIKFYYIRLSEIIRNYIEQRYQIMAPELTTEEIIQALKNITQDSCSLQLLSQLLTLADLVKFARVLPEREENADQIELATEYIKRTSTGTGQEVGENQVMKTERLKEIQV